MRPTTLLARSATKLGLHREQFAQQFDAIAALEKDIEEKSKPAPVAENETRTDMVKRVGVGAWVSTEAATFTLKLKHLLTDLGKRVADLAKDDSLSEPLELLNAVKIRIHITEDALKAYASLSRADHDTFCRASRRLFVIGGMLSLLLVVACCIFNYRQKTREATRTTSGHVSSANISGILHHTPQTISESAALVRKLIAQEYPSSMLTLDEKTGNCELRLDAERSFVFVLKEMDSYRICVMKMDGVAQAAFFSRPHAELPIQETVGSSSRLLQFVHFAWKGDAEDLRGAWHSLVLWYYDPSKIEERKLNVPPGYKGLGRTVNDVLLSAYSANVAFGYERYGLASKGGGMVIDSGHYNPTIELWGPRNDLQRIAISSKMNVSWNQDDRDNVIKDHLQLADALGSDFGEWIRTQMRAALSRSDQRYSQVKDVGDGRRYGIFVRIREQPNYEELLIDSVMGVASE